jgi:putative molybdopterin biosynthesis protein
VSDRREFRDLASPAELEATIADLDLGGETETVSVAAARGRVLAERVDADVDVPGFDRAAMDGYAVRAEDTVGASESTPVTLDLAGVVHPGEEPEAAVDPGTAVETSTGAVLPPGADAVVVVEETSETASGVDIRTAVAPGDAVMAAGTDVAAGERALGPGRRLTPREIGLLSAIGVETVSVRAPPTVGIVSTGDELVRPGEPLATAAGQIHDVNSYAVAAAVEDAGGDPVVYPHVGDDEAALESLLVEAAGACDLVLSSGSTSASAVDVVYRVVESRGELLLHGVAVKPGKPTLVGRLGGAAYVGLPGYPVSALSIFRAFVAPAIRAAAGRPEAPSARVPAEVAVRERFDEGRRWLAPVGLLEDGDGSLLAYPVDKGSGATTTLVDADGVVEVAADTDYLSPGETVDVALFSADVRPPRVLVVGEADPALSRLLDGVDRPRFLARGSRGGARSLRDGIADVGVLSGPVEPHGEVTTLAEWRREWGLVVPAGNPADVEGLVDLVERDLQLANRDGQSGLRQRFDAALSALAVSGEATPAGSIGGSDLETRGVESPARRVAAGSADAGLGLRATASRLDLGFVPLGTEAVRLVANPDRAAKPGVEGLADAADSMADVTGELPGYHVP